jgi:hypothetical protein
MPVADECALRVLFGKTWRTNATTPDPGNAGKAAFIGEIGLTTSGRVVVRVPSQPPLASENELVGGVLRVPWTAGELSAFHTEFASATKRQRESVADCRDWLAAIGQHSRHSMLENLLEAARRTAPFVLYAGERRYTNFREHNTMLGKTLWPGHPDCALSNLATIPLELWSDSDVLMVVCLTLLVRSATCWSGPASPTTGCPAGTRCRRPRRTRRRRSTTLPRRWAGGAGRPWRAHSSTARSTAR